MSEFIFDTDYILDLLDRAPDENETQFRGFLNLVNGQNHLILIERFQADKQLSVKHYIFPDVPEVYEKLSKAYKTLNELKTKASDFSIGFEALLSVLGEYLVMDELSDGF